MAVQRADALGFDLEDAPSGDFILRSKVGSDRMKLHEPLTLEKIERNLEILGADALPPLP